MNKLIRNEFVIISIFLISLVGALSLYSLLVVLGLIAFIFLLKKYQEKFVLFYTITGFLSITNEAFGTYADYIKIFLLLSLAAIFYKRAVIEKNGFKKVPKPVFYFLFFYFAALFISLMFSSFLMVSITAILRSLLFLGICYIYYYFTNKESYYIYIYSLFLVVIIVGLSFLKDFSLDAESLLLEGVVTRYAGIYGNPNYVGLLIVITLPISLILFKKNTNKLYRLLLGSFTLLEIIILLLSNSRSAILGTFIASLFILSMLYKKKFFYLLSSFLLVIALFISLNYNTVSKYLGIYLRIERINNREVFWQSGLDVIKDHPYVGLGADTFDKYFFTYAPSWVGGVFESGNWANGKVHPHNYFLYFMAENGFIGLIAVCLLFYVFFYIGFKAMKKTISGEYYFSVASFGIGLALFLRAFYEVTGIMTYGYIIRDLPFWLILIITAHFYNNQSPNDNI